MATLSPETVNRLIWVTAYRPFMMGGNVNAPIGCNMECMVVDLGKGFKGLLVNAPDGSTVVAEFESGGIVGHTIEQVRLDIEEGEVDLMKDQIQEAVRMSKTVDNVGFERFWKHYNGGQHYVVQHMEQ